MKRIINNLLFLFVINCSQTVYAELHVTGSDEFKRNVKINLVEAQKSSIYLNRLINKITDSSAEITIRPITDDVSTWHKSGKKSRSHTKPLDDKDRGAERSAATDSIIYLNTNRVNSLHKSYKSGTLIHELAHAYDLASGHYNAEYPVREKRAVFFQNLWRNSHSKKIRTDYHGRFETMEFQKARSTGRLNMWVKGYFLHNEVP